MVSHAVGRIHTASFATPFRLRKDVSICYNSEVIITSGFAAMLNLMVENVSYCHTRSNVAAWITDIEQVFVDLIRFQIQILYETEFDTVTFRISVPL